MRFNTVAIGFVDNGASTEKGGLTKEMPTPLSESFASPLAHEPDPPWREPL